MAQGSGRVTVEKSGWNREGGTVKWNSDRGTVKVEQGSGTLTVKQSGWNTEEER